MTDRIERIGFREPEHVCIDSRLPGSFVFFDRVPDAGNDIPNSASVAPGDAADTDVLIAQVEYLIRCSRVRRRIPALNRDHQPEGVVVSVVQLLHLRGVVERQLVSELRVVVSVDGPGVVVKALEHCCRIALEIFLFERLDGGYIVYRRVVVIDVVRPLCGPVVDHDVDFVSQRFGEVTRRERGVSERAFVEIETGLVSRPEH
ncbi:hypothetical protein [Halostagnicola sp. GCM10023243]|uniref:hypothetical protein n=1 Tax=Halostagnicola sp. GCM10023243 TaxID=3252682 RepID=UPI003613C7AB